MKKFIVGICLALVCIGFNSCAVYGVDEHYMCVGRRPARVVVYDHHHHSSHGSYPAYVYRDLGNVYSPSHNPSRRPIAGHPAVRKGQGKPTPRINRTDKRR